MAKKKKARAKAATKKASKQRKIMMGFIVQPKERRVIKSNAAAHGMSFSAWIREASILYRRAKGKKHAA